MSMLYLSTLSVKIETGPEIQKAIEEAIDTCIERNILKEYLIRNKAGVIAMMLTEYDERLHEKTLLEQGIEQGQKQGQKQGQEQGNRQANQLIKLLLDHSRADEIERAVTDAAYQKKLFKEFNL